MPTLESMAASEVLNRGPKSRAFYRIQATRKLTGGGNLIRRKAATDRRDSVIDDTAFATMIDDDVTRLFFEPGHYTVFENVGSFKLTVMRQVSRDNRTPLFKYKLNLNSYIAVKLSEWNRLRLSAYLDSELRCYFNIVIHDGCDDCSHMWSQIPQK